MDQDACASRMNCAGLLLLSCLLGFVPTLFAAEGATFHDFLDDGSEGPEMVPIQAGCFKMGSPDDEVGRDNDERQHKVCLKRFSLGRYEVTNAQFRRFRPEHDSGSITGMNLNADNQPVANVSLRDAQAYVDWLSKKSGKRYRLPTEAEWEYAARAGTTTARFWGDDASQACSYANVHNHSAVNKRRYTWTHHDCEDGYVATSSVGSFKANAFGLHDMAGNLWEWTCSIYQQQYAGAELQCAASDDARHHVLRGGSWMNVPNRVRSASRSKHPPHTGDAFHGFRVVSTARN